MFYSEDIINDKTGFANGEEFTSYEQVRDYFTVSNMVDMFGKSQTLTQEELDDMAECVIRNGWNMRKVDA